MRLMLKKLFFLSCILFCNALFTNAQQPTREELQKQQQQLLRELNELNSDLNNIRKNKKAALGAYALVQRKIAARESLINNINKEIRNLEETIYHNQIEIYRLKKELDTLKIQYAKSLVFAYKNRGNYDYLNFLFSAQNFNDALKRFTYLKSYRQYRATQAQTIAQTQTLLQEKMGVLNNNRNEKTAVLQSQSSQLKVLEEDKDEKNQVVKQLKDQEKDIAAQIKQREKDQLRLRKAIDAAVKRAIAEAEAKAKLAKQKAQEDEKRKQQLLQQQRDKEARDLAKNNAPKSTNNAPVTELPKPSANTPKTNEPITAVTSPERTVRAYSSFESTPEGLEMSLNFEKNKGRLPWPIDGGIITGHFGRVKYGDTRLIAENDGLFFKASIGANVKCIADGVVTATPDFEQTQAVIVRHGKYFTIYSNLSSVNVQVDQEVKAGTVLGKVGAGLDGDGQFQIQVLNEKQKFVDPEFWLKRR